MYPKSKATRFGLVRHAETRWNREKRIQGQRDSALTGAGRNQADRWGGILKSHCWRRMLASDVGRAVETATRINAVLNIELTFDSRLREQDWGDWAGKTISQIRAGQPRMLAELAGAGWDFRPPGGEDRRSVLARSKRALEDAAARWPGEDILVVTHGGVIKSLIYHLSGRRFLPSEPPLIESNRLHWLIQDAKGIRLEKANALVLDSNAWQDPEIQGDREP